MHSISDNGVNEGRYGAMGNGRGILRKSKVKNEGGQHVGKSMPYISGKTERSTLFFVLISWLRPIGLLPQKIFLKK